MKAAYSDDFCTLYTGTALDVLRKMPDKSVHMAVTSPPYWGLRSYLPQDHPAKGQEIGTEKTPDEFVQKLVEVFAEVWRVLRDDGTLWVNIGDSYANDGKWGGSTGGKHVSELHGTDVGRRRRYTGLKTKDLCMIPARLAIALQSWGWYLRQELVWSKDSCMPESVRDRCTRSHEFVYMLTKRATYFYDNEAIKETASNAGATVKLGSKSFSKGQPAGAGIEPSGNATQDIYLVPAGRNARSVWRINPRHYPGSHFATFPPELPMRCIKAGTSEKGVCSECWAPWKRVVERPERIAVERSERDGEANPEMAPDRKVGHAYQKWLDANPAQRVGWEPTCEHEEETATDETHRQRGTINRNNHSAGHIGSMDVLGHVGVVPATVLDPFAGSGTTLYAARKLGRKSIGIDLDPKSAELLEDRLGPQGVLL